MSDQSKSVRIGLVSLGALAGFVMLLMLFGELDSLWKPTWRLTVHTNHAEANMEAVELMKKLGSIKDGDLVIITKGDLMGTGGGTNAMKIVEVGNMPQFVA